METKTMFFECLYFMVPNLWFVMEMIAQSNLKLLCYIPLCKFTCLRHHFDHVYRCILDIYWNCRFFNADNVCNLCKILIFPFSFWTVFYNNNIKIYFICLHIHRKWMSKFLQWFFLNWTISLINIPVNKVLGRIRN